VVQDTVYNHPRLEKFLRFLYLKYFRIFHFARFHGIENLPPPGACLFAPNHQSYYDPMLMAVGQPLPMYFLAWNALFTKGYADRFLRFMGAYPVDPEGADPGGYRDCLNALRSGKRVMIFPEGARSYDGKLQPFREGVARLAMKANVPVAPICITGGQFAWPRAETFPRPFTRLDVTYLPPIYPRPARTPAERHAEAARITDELARTIQDCLDAHERTE